LRIALLAVGTLLAGVFLPLAVAAMIFTLLRAVTFAEEGMWLLPQIGKLPLQDMKKSVIKRPY
jgi:hypothetical protein